MTDSRLLTDGGRDRVDTIAIIDRETGSHVSYDGPFDSDREGHCVEISIPIGHAKGEITPTTAENLSQRSNDIAVTTWATDVETTGIIEAVDVIEERLVVRINDGSAVDPDKVEIDPAEVGVDG